MQSKPFEDYPTTKEGGVAFVRDMFHMGGTVVPPRKTLNDSSLIDFDDAYCENGMYFQHPVTNQPITMTRPHKSNALDDTFLMDFGNSCLANHWDSSAGPHPTGVRRYENEKWADMILTQVYPNSDIHWCDFCEWVMTGGGDEWFQ